MISLFVRAYLQIALVSANVANIAAGHYVWAFLTGFGISYVWWLNARSAGRVEGRGGHLAYALGAACGTITGMYLARTILR